MYAWHLLVLKINSGHKLTNNSLEQRNIVDLPCQPGFSNSLDAAEQDQIK